MSGKEHITIQVGNYANYVGAHFWNFQDELFARIAEDEDLQRRHQFDLSKLYRISKTHDGKDVYTPRLLVVDRKENMGTYHPDSSSFHGTLGGAAVDRSAQSEYVPWGGSVTQVKAKPMNKNAFLQMLDEEEAARLIVEAGGTVREDGSYSFTGLLDSEVNSWSDYLKVYYNPRFVNPIQLRTSHDFDNFFVGRSVDHALSADAVEGVLDDVRGLLEESDSAACATIMADSHDGFSGLAVQIAQFLRDEMRGVAMPVWTFSAEEGVAEGASKSELLRQCGDTVATTEFCEYASIVVPFHTGSVASMRNLPCSVNTFPDPMVKLALPFHTSAIIASVIETITGQARITDLPAPGFFGRDEMAHRWTVYDWISASTNGGKLPLCAVEASFGCPHTVEDVEAFFAPSSCQGSMNPMLQSLSAAVHGPLGGLHAPMKGTSMRGSSRWADGDASGSDVEEDGFDENESRAFTNGTKSVSMSVFSNVLFSRGCHDTALRDRMQERLSVLAGSRERGRAAVPMQAYQQRRVNLPIPLSFPSIFHPTPEMVAAHPSLYCQDRIAELELTAATGTSSLVRRHLVNHASLFSSCSRKIKPQLAAAGFDGDECAEMEEKLRDLSERYC